MRPVFALLLIAAPVVCRAAPDVAIFARAFNGYTRARLPDNSFKPESFVFSEGAHRLPVADPSIDSLSFVKIAHILANPLKARGYVPSFDPQHTDQVIFVYWGMTAGSEGGKFSYGQDALLGAIDRWNGQVPRDAKLAPPGSAAANMGKAEAGEMELAMEEVQMANRARDENDAKNAALLGYREQLARSWQIPWFSQARDAAEEIEWDRYYVVLIAVDYRTLVQKKAYKLLWEAKASIPARSNPFDDNLAGMANAASRFFGENLRGLVHEKMPEGMVKVGVPVPVKDAPAK